METKNNKFAHYSHMALSRSEMKQIVGGDDRVDSNRCVSCSDGRAVFRCVGVNTALGHYCTCSRRGLMGC